MTPHCSLSYPTNHISFIYPTTPNSAHATSCASLYLLGRDTLSVIVNHWPSRLGGQELSEPMRIAAAELTRHIADSLWACDPERAIIVMGDLNDDPADASCTRVLGGREDPYDVAPHSFLNPWIKIHASGRGTLTYRGQWNLFDQILVGGTLLPDNGASSLIYTGARIMDLDFIKAAWRTLRRNALAHIRLSMAASSKDIPTISPPKYSSSPPRSVSAWP